MCMLYFVLITSVILNLSCVWIWPEEKGLCFQKRDGTLMRAAFHWEALLLLLLPNTGPSSHSGALVTH